MDDEKTFAQLLKEHYADAIRKADGGVITDAQAAAAIYPDIRKRLAGKNETGYVRRIIQKRPLAVQIIIDLVKEYDVKAIEIFNKGTWDK